MRFTVKEPHIELYKDGFKDKCELGRSITGEKLSGLVESIADPMVIALDGAWGSGKSFFLKCWVGEHLNRADNTTETIYFDAFKHDFLDDPLIALTGAIAARFEKNEVAPKAVDTLKRIAPALGRTLLRVGISAATLGIVSHTDDLVNDMTKTLSGELADAVTDFWRQENSKLNAMEAFKEALVEMTQPEESGGAPRKLVIVIDELDRCRPDYALSLLETIKHFFSVDNVHFVLGVNLQEMENSVRARYGEGVNAQKYLQKFYQIKMPLDIQVNRSGDSGKILPYFWKFSAGNGFDLGLYATPLATLVSIAELSNNISLRDVHHLLVRANITPSFNGSSDQWPNAIAALIYFDVMMPELLRKIDTNTKLSPEIMKEVTKLFPRLGEDLGPIDHGNEMYNCIRWLCGQGKENEVMKEQFKDISAPTLIANYIRPIQLNFR